MTLEEAMKYRGETVLVTEDGCEVELYGGKAR